MTIVMRSAIAALCIIVSATAPRAQTPARDATAVATKGTAVISGIVTDQDQRPLRGALVSAAGASMPVTAMTDEKGRFAVRGLPAGRYSVSAVKPAYLWQTFGATRAGGPGVTIVLADAQTADASMTLTRGGVIAGTLTNGKGRPIQGMSVIATTLPSSGQWDAVSFSARPAVVTDATGAYRLFGLPPADYLVVGLLPSPVRGTIERPGVKDVDDLLARLSAKKPGEPVEAPSVPKGAAPPLQPPPAGAFAPVFYPGTTNWHSATLVHIAGGDERNGVDFSVTASPMVTIEGAIQGAVSDLSKVELSLIVDSPQFGFNYGARPILAQPPDASGKFRYENVTPGHYTITARGLPAGVTSTERINSSAGATMMTNGGVPRDGSDYLYGLAEIDATAGAGATVAVALQPGATIRGRLMIENGTGVKDPDLGTARVRVVSLQPISTSSTDNTQIGNGFLSPGVSAPQADGSVAIHGIFPGDFTVGCYLPPEFSKTWWLRAAMSNGRDLLDGPFSIRAGDDISDVQFVLTDRHSELKGKLSAATGRPAPDFFVIVIPEDPALWVPKSRRVRTARPASDGAFSFADLPAGNYLIGALTDVTEREWNDPKFLASLAPAAVKVTVALGQVTVQDLRIGGGQPY
jgi:hypothetical protein